MCGRIDCFENQFVDLATTGLPAKPLLLLAVLDLIATKMIIRQFIEISPALISAYASYWQQLAPELPANLPEPFQAMDQEPFWRIISRPGIIQPDTTCTTLDQLKEFYIGAKLDQELFPLLLMEPLRKRLQTALISTHFKPPIQPALIELGKLNQSH